MAAYAYVMVFASVVMFVVGWSNFNQSALSTIFGQKFAYSREYVSCDAPVKVSEPNAVPCEGTYEYDLIAPKRDLIQGVTLMVVAAVLGVLHLLMTKRISKTKETDFIHRTFILLGLIAFGIGTLIALPIGIFTTINYFLYGIVDSNRYFPSDSQIPGPSLAVAVALLPIWIWFLVQFQNRTHAEREK